MSKRADPTLIGGFVVGAIALLAAGILVFGKGQIFARPLPVRLYFRENVNGLLVGAPVKFKGVDIGSVKQVQLVSREGSGLIDPPVLVLIALDEEKIRRQSGATLEAMNTMLDVAIGQGLRAQLQVESIVTGVLFIDLAFHPEIPAVYFGTKAPDQELVELPTIASSGEELRASVKSLMAKLDKMDIDGLVNSLRDTSTSIRERVESREAGNTLAHVEAIAQEIRAASTKLAPLFDTFEQAGTTVVELENELRPILQRASDLVSRVERQIGPLLDSLQDTADGVGLAVDEISQTTRAARQSLAPDSPVIYDLRMMLDQMERTAHSLELLLGLLERDPSVLLRGREPQESGK